MNEKESNIKDTPEKEPNHTQAEIPKPEPIVSSIQLSAVGDILIHNEVYEDAI